MKNYILNAFEGDFTYMWNLKTKINEKEEQKQTYKYREHFDGCRWEWGWGPQ